MTPLITLLVIKNSTGNLSTVWDTIEVSSETLKETHLRLQGSFSSVEDIWETKDQHKHSGFFSPCPCGWSPLPVPAGLSPWPRVRVRRPDADRYIRVCRWGAAEIQSGWAAAQPQLCVRSEPPGAEDWSPETHDGRSVLRSNVTLHTAAVLLISCLNVCLCISLNTRRIQQQANHVLMTGLSRQVQRSVTWLNTHTHTQN